MYKITKQIFTLLIFSIFLFSCNSNQSKNNFEIREGDLFFQNTGTSEIDNAIKSVTATKLSKNYSHVGIAMKKNEKTTIEADYGVLYSATSIVDLRGNVLIKGNDGKKLETSQLYYDRANEWAFTQEKFTFTNPDDGTVMDGEGMDIQKDLQFLNAHKTYGLMLIKEEKDD